MANSGLTKTGDILDMAAMGKRLLETAAKLPEDSDTLMRSTICAVCRQNEAQFGLAEGTGPKLCGHCKYNSDCAADHNARHFRMPLRYQRAEHRPDLEIGRSYLLVNPDNGVGKTHNGYGLLRQLQAKDPRITFAAYYWPDVLYEVRKGYGRTEYTTGDEMVEALRKSGAVLIDDIAAEKITDSNQGWIQEILLRILDYRWREMLPVVITSNATGNGLVDYLGPRLVSRILGMCGEPIVIAGGDRRLEGK